MKAAVAEVKDVWGAPARALLVGIIAVILVVGYASWNKRTDTDRIDGLESRLGQVSTENAALKAQLGDNQRANECRSRAAALLDQAESRASRAAEVRTGAAIAALVRSAAERNGVPLPPDYPQQVGQIPALNNESLARSNDAANVADQRVQAVAECSRNPEYIPPIGR